MKKDIARPLDKLKELKLIAETRVAQGDNTYTKKVTAFNGQVAGVETFVAAVNQMHMGIKMMKTDQDRICIEEGYLCTYVSIYIHLYIYIYRDLYI